MDVCCHGSTLEEDDSITGYQILRGPDADSLVVIEDDTGSSSTSYTDETPPAGQTHTYAVKARNASGLSPLSNTLTATVPAAREEQVLIVARQESTGDTLVSNLGQTAVSDGAVAGTYQGTQVDLAIPFRTGDNALGYQPTNVQLYIKHLLDDIPTFQVSIRGDSAGFPADTALYDLNTSTTSRNNYQLFTFTTPDEATLLPNTKYYVHIAATGGTANIQQTASDDEDTQSHSDWHIGNNKIIRVTSSAWTSSNNTLKIGILGHAIFPPPETFVSNLGQTAVSDGAVAGTYQGTQVDLAIPFRTGDNALGYQPTNVQLYIKHLLDDIPTFQVSIRGDSAGFPADTALYDLNTSTTSRNNYQLFTFTTLDEATLLPNTKYYVHIAATGGTANIQQTASDDEDTQSHPDWHIGNNKIIRVTGSAWTSSNNTLKIGIFRHAIFTPPDPTTMVSNLGQTAVSDGAQAGFVSGNHHETAMSFTTGDNALGYQPTSVQLYIKHLLDDIPTFQVSIRGDSAGVPADTALYDLNTSTTSRNNYQLFTFTTPDEATLLPNTKYHVHIAATGGTANIQQTASDDEDTQSHPDWRLGNNKIIRVTGSAWTSSNNTLKIGILGHAIFPPPDTLVSNLGQTAVSDGAQAGFVSGNHHETAMSFRTGSNALRYRPTSIQLYLSRVSESPLVHISIREDNAGLPSETTLARLNMSTAITADANIPQLITFTISGEVTLQPDTLYWLHVNASTTVAPAGVRQTASDDEDTESQAGWSIGDHRVSRIDGGAWTTPTSRNSLQMRILGHIILPTIVDLPADITTTARLAVNESVTGQHEHGRDVDWFAFAAEADTNYQFTANQGQKFATLNVLRIFQARLYAKFRGGNGCHHVGTPPLMAGVGGFFTIRCQR